jgi:hypothetical protein
MPLREEPPQLAMAAQQTHDLLRVALIKAVANLERGG